MDYLITMDEFKDSDVLRVSQIRKAIRSARPVVPVDGVHAIYSEGAVLDASGTVIATKLFTIKENQV